MANQTNKISTPTSQVGLLDEWQQKAREAAERFNLPLPSDQELGSVQEVEQRLRQVEQEGGE